MTNHDVEVRLMAATVNRTTKERQFFRNADGVMFVQGEIETIIVASAALSVAATTTIPMTSGTEGTGSGSVIVGYPSGGVKGDLVIYAAASKKHTDPFTNANFRPVGWGGDNLAWDDVNHDDVGALGADMGPVRAEHHIRELTGTVSGSETFSTAGTAGNTLNTSVAAQMHLFKKSTNKEWLVKSYGCWGGWLSRTGSGTVTDDFGLTSAQYKVTDKIIYGIANNPITKCTLMVAGSTEVWKSSTGFNWQSSTHPFGGTDIAYRLRFGNGVFLMAGAQGKIARSTTDGGTWTVSQPLGSGFIWRGLRYYGNRWIAVGDAGRLITSDDDGQTWTQRTTGVSVTIYDVAWSLGKQMNPDGSTAYDAYNGGLGRWWYCADGWRMFQSNDNGNTWSEGPYYDTDFIAALSGYGDPLAMYASESRQFYAVGNNRGDYFNNGAYAYATHGIAGDYGWDFYMSGPGGYLLFTGNYDGGRIAYARDTATMMSTTPGIEDWAQVRNDIASSMHNGIAIGQQFESPTNRPQNLVEYSIEYQKLGKPYLPAEIVYPNQYFKNKFGPTKYFYRDGGTWSMIKGYANGYVHIQEYNNVWQQQGYYNEDVASGTSYCPPDIRDGDLLVITIASNSNLDDVSNIYLKQYNTTQQIGTSPQPDPLSFTPFTIIGSTKSTSGDHVNVYTGYCYAVGRINPIWREDTSYAVGNSNRYLVDWPRLQLIWTGTADSRYTYVITVLRQVDLMSVDTEVTASITTVAEVKKTGIEPGSPGHLYTASMIADAFVEPNSTPSIVTGFYNFTETSGSSFTTSIGSVNYEVGTLLVFFSVCDNLSATTPTITISDTKGNTWTQMAYRGQNASAAAGVVGAIHYTILTNRLVPGDTITQTLSGTVACKMLMCFQFAGIGADGLRSAAVTSSGSSATPSVTSGTVNAGDLVVAMAGVENATAPTADTDTLNGSWNASSGTIAVSGSGGNAAGHMSQYSTFKIVTASGAQTFNPATSPSTDWIEIIGVFANNPKQFTAAVIRSVASMTVQCIVNKTFTTTASLGAVAKTLELADADVEKDTSTVIYLDAHPDLTATALQQHGSPASLDAVAGMNVTGYVPMPQNTTASLSAAAALSSTMVNVVRAEASMTTVAYTTSTQGNVYDVQASMSASAGMEVTYPFIVADSTVGWPDFGYPPTVWNMPTYYPGFEGWSTSPTGGTGNVVELTNRHYWETLESAKGWQEWPIANGPTGGNMLLEIVGWGVPTVGARAHAITPLGGERFLVTWVQENWLPYHVAWSGTAYLARILDMPLCICATILDCSVEGDPRIVGSNRYDLSSEQWSHWRTTTGQGARPMGDGRVACVWSGFLNSNITEEAFDYGTFSISTEDAVNFVCVIDASSNVPTFNWVKTFASIGGQLGWNNEMLVNGNDVCVVSYSYESCTVHKFNGSNGALMGSSSPSFTLYDEPYGRASCANEGAQGYIFGKTSSGMVSQGINLSTLSWGSVNSLQFQGNTFNPQWTLYRSKRGDDGYWYAAGTHSGQSMFSVLKLKIGIDGLTIESIHMSDTAHEAPATTPPPYSLGNAYATDDWVEIWVPFGFGDESVIPSLYPKTAFCPGRTFPSVAGVAHGMYTEDPMRPTGPQVVAYIPPISDTQVPARAPAWVSPPVNSPLNTWSHYWPEGEPSFGEIDIVELANGMILCVISCVSSANDAVENGLFRIFTYIVDPQAEPPPLKLSQRDDGKMVGGDRLGYDPQNSGAIRAGRVAW